MAISRAKYEHGAVYLERGKFDDGSIAENEALGIVYQGGEQICTGIVLFLLTISTYMGTFPVCALFTVMMASSIFTA